MSNPKLKEIQNNLKQEIQNNLKKEGFRVEGLGFREPPSNPQKLEEPKRQNTGSATSCQEALPAFRTTGALVIRIGCWGYILL